MKRISTQTLILILIAFAIGILISIIIFATEELRCLLDI